MLSKQVSVRDCLIVVLGLFVIGLFTFFYGRNTDVVSHLGLAATLISIVLSVIAIIYTLYQSMATLSQTEQVSQTSSKLAETAVKIESASSGFQDIRGLTDKLAHASTNLNETADAFHATVQALADVKAELTAAVETKLREQITPVHTSLQDMFSLVQSTRHPSNNLSVTTSSPSDLPSFLMPLQMAALYLCMRQAQAPREMSVTTLIERTMGNTQRSSFDVIYSYGVIQTFFSTGYIHIEEISPTFKVRLTSPGAADQITARLADMMKDGAMDAQQLRDMTTRTDELYA